MIGKSVDNMFNGKRVCFFFVLGNKIQTIPLLDELFV